MISQNSIQHIQQSIDIIDIVGSFVKLKKRGANYLGNCPFHNEKTPSFTVSPSKEIYKCFGCGKSGNAISFVMEHEKYGYVDALKWLAERYNIDIEETYSSDEQKQQYLTADSLFIINNFAREFYADIFFNTEDGQDIGLSYMKERGFREDILKKFNIGFAPEKGDAFTKEAIHKQYNKELLLRSGLVVERNNHLQDNYRGRIIFPIHNHSGKVIGFGARIIKSTEKAPKYINTPENELYVKSKILYGSYFARQAIDKNDECLLVEGYTDVLSLHQAGIENTVASGGTALTPDQLRLVKKYTNNLTIIYDGDQAGIKAALRGLDLALEEGLNVKLVLIPDKEDPDSYLNKVGTTAFLDFIDKNKKDFILFQLEIGLKDVRNDTGKKAEIVNQIAETISKINKAEDFTRQQDYIKQCAEMLKIDENGMHTLVNKFIRNRIALQEKSLPFEEAKYHEENAKVASSADFEDATFNLLFKDELQEREIARVLIEHGLKKWDDDQIIAQYIFSEILDDGLFDNQDILKLINEYKNALFQNPLVDSKSYFIYHPEKTISSLSVSLLSFPYEESVRWKNEFSHSTGYQKALFEQSFEDFVRAAATGNEENLSNFSKLEEDKTQYEIESAINYIRLRKIKKLLLENQLDMEKPHNEEENKTLHDTHEHLKKMEKDIAQKLGTVIIR